jgi:hypothetical protein
MMRRILNLGNVFQGMNSLFLRTLLAIVNFHVTLIVAGHRPPSNASDSGQYGMAGAWYGYEIQGTVPDRVKFQQANNQE